jgi:hypothetical protein
MRALRPNKTCLVCLAGVVGLVAAGCGGSSSTQRSVASTPAKKAVPSVTNHTATHPAKGTAATKKAAAPTAAVKAPTHTATASKPAAPAIKAVPKVATPHPVPIPAARTKIGPPKQWSGTGNQVLGTIALPRNVVVHWTVSGGQFAVADGSGKLAISGKGATGQSFAASGRYAAVKVTANGKWTLTMASLGA